MNVMVTMSNGKKFDWLPIIACSISNRLLKRSCTQPSIQVSSCINNTLWRTTANDYEGGIPLTAHANSFSRCVPHWIISIKIANLYLDFHGKDSSDLNVTLSSE